MQLVGPYVLVGQSFGGLNMQLYARLHPAEAAGLVLVDAAHEDSYDPAIAPCAVCGGVDYAESARQVRAAPPLPDLPLVVLAHARPSVLPAAAEARWPAWQHDLAARAPRGRLVVAERSGHNIHLDEPDLVVAAIRDVVGAVRQ